MLKAKPDHCEEAALGFTDAYVPCNRPAVAVIAWRGRTDPGIRVCEMCRDHNVKNRGAYVANYVVANSPLNVKNTDEAMAAALFQERETVDALGVIKAQIAELEQKEKALTDALKAAGKDSYFGRLYDCTVSHSWRESYDMPRLKADLGDVLLEYAKPAIKIVTLRITARK